MWFVFITMTTVGYGDVYAKSHAGRAITILAAFIGVVIVSLFVVSLYITLGFDLPQARSYTLLQRLVLKDELRKSAVGMLSTKYKIKMLQRKILNNFDPKVDIKLRRELQMA